MTGKNQEFQPFTEARNINRLL